MQKGLAVMAHEVHTLWTNQKLEALHALTTQGESLSKEGVLDLFQRLFMACRHLATRPEDKQLFTSLMSHLSTQQSIAMDRLLRRHLDSVLPGESGDTLKQKRALLRLTRKLVPTSPLRLKKTTLTLSKRRAAKK